MWYNRRWKGGSQNAFNCLCDSTESILVKIRGEPRGIQLVLPVCYFYKIHHNSNKFKGHWGGRKLSEVLFCLHFSGFFYVIFVTWLTSPYILTWSFTFSKHFHKDCYLPEKWSESMHIHQNNKLLHNVKDARCILWSCTIQMGGPLSSSPQMSSRGN